MSPTTFSATTTTPQDDEIRAPRPIVVAGIELPEEEMWRLWLRLKKKDIKTPVDPGRCLVAVLELGDFVRRYGFRFTVLGEEIDDPIGYLLVTSVQVVLRRISGHARGTDPALPGGEMRGACPRIP
ncbi:hypothetical protein OH76DRAFT_1411546 [Lentinus brumalis]|uniref:Uncharacterized protein n=1 Tax=Lentinus brumalis TaxID=2498619 RepID=A0A371CNY4_9APHY|nr:hypothetical protein OH76DRAFT_1411546 [Polyporus brumalis]